MVDNSISFNVFFFLWVFIYFLFLGLKVEEDGVKIIMV